MTLGPVVLAALALGSAEDGIPVAIGTRQQIHSAVLDEDRSVFVSLPSSYFASLSRRWGYAILPPAGLVEWVGESLVEKKRYTEAEALLRRNLEAHPRSAWAMSALAEALEAAGRAEEAEWLLEAAVARGRERADPDLYQYSDALERLRHKRAPHQP